MTIADISVTGTGRVKAVNLYKNRVVGYCIAVILFYFLNCVNFLVVLLGLIGVRFCPTLRYIELPCDLITPPVLHELAKVGKILIAQTYLYALINPWRFNPNSSEIGPNTKGQILPNSPEVGPNSRVFADRLTDMHGVYSQALPCKLLEIIGIPFNPISEWSC